MRIVILGAPGCGKGTQGHRLSRHYKIPEISTGDLLREAVAAGTPLGRAAKAVMDVGQLVSDEIVLGVLRERLLRADARKGFILDGFPRNANQAEQLDELLGQLGQPIDLAVLIDVDVDLIMQRLLGRRSCLSCGASYNVFFAPPKMDDRCDECGGRLKRRSDDTEEIIGNRLRTYEIQTAPVVERYREQGLSGLDDQSRRPHASPLRVEGERGVDIGSVSAAIGALPHQVGTEIGPYSFGASRLDLVRYAGASGDFNPIHFDHDAARAAGLDGIVVHGLLMSAWVTRVAAAVGSGDAPVAELKVRFRQALRPGLPAVVQGSVGDVDEAGSQRMALTLRHGEVDLVTATAKVRRQ